MACFRPIEAYRARRLNENGRRPLVFNKAEGYLDKKIRIPCGKCIGCKLETSRQWAIRCMNEAKMYQDNCFITLTYDDNTLPCTPEGIPTLEKRDFQLFMKSLRKKNGPNIRFFHCGEYGELFDRPHHHACIFNFDFPDKMQVGRSGNFPIYESEQLEKLWPHGFHTIAAVTWETAAYTARYITKKITGEQADAHYEQREPEYTTMSRRPGIGKPWFDKFMDDLYNYDECVVRDKFVVKPAKYYDKKFEEINPRKMRQIKYHREVTRPPEADYNRLAVRENNANLKFYKQSKRSFESCNSQSTQFVTTKQISFTPSILKDLNNSQLESFNRPSMTPKRP